ncbi:hypothetical protein RRF57_000502 [Xylaria bambusicola]|uniref:Uncharacterized protein n=1 Tax=Xylaria bambusicola TaxID=326684 RepID=A0AAN7Z5L6_9PEZI
MARHVSSIEVLSHRRPRSCSDIACADLRRVRPASGTILVAAAAAAFVGKGQRQKLVVSAVLVFRLHRPFLNSSIHTLCHWCQWRGFYSVD